MRRLLGAAAALAVLAAACSSPRPCTQALCPLPMPATASYRVRGWTTSVVVSSGVPVLPIVSDATVDVLSGQVAFSNDKAVVVADSGATFLFQVSSGPVAVPSLLVTEGKVSVALSSTAALSPLTPGTTFYLPVAKKK